MKNLLWYLRVEIHPQNRSRVNDTQAWSNSFALFYDEVEFNSMIKNYIFQYPEHLEISRYTQSPLPKNTCIFSIFVDFFFLIPLLTKSPRNWLKSAHWIVDLKTAMSELDTFDEKLKLYYAIFLNFKRIKFLPCHSFNNQNGQDGDKQKKKNVKNTFHDTKKINQIPYLLIRKLSDYPLYW